MINNEQKLWNRVIEQAKFDLTADTENYTRNNIVNEKRRAKESVISWIGSTDFVAVCKMAGADVDKILEEFLILREKNNEC